MAIRTSAAYRAAAIGVTSAALLVGAFSLGVGRGGSGSGQAAAATLTSASTTGRITVTGTGTVTGVPDQVILSMSVQVNDYSVTAALDGANAIVRRVTAALEALGVPRSGIQTSGMNIYPNYSNNSQIPTGYNVSEPLTVTMNQISRAGRQIQAAVQAGGNAVTVDNVSLNISSTGPLMAAARASAMKDAKAQAQQFAGAANVTLGPIISITPVQQSTPGPVPYALNSNGALKAAPARVPISPGSQQLSVQVTVVYAA